MPADNRKQFTMDSLQFTEVSPRELFGRKSRGVLDFPEPET